MNPLPHFADLPPATSAQAHHIYSMLRVTPRLIHFDRLTSALAIGAEVYVLLIYWLILRFGLAAKIRDFAEKIAPKYLCVQGALTYILLSVVSALAGLPSSIYRSYYLPRSYGLTSESVWQWQSDHWKAIGLDALTNSLIAGVILLIIRNYPKRWPQIAAALITPIVAFSVFVSPVLIDPLFNHFSLYSQSRPLYAEIHAVAERAGIGNAAIYVVDKSKQTNETNAYVTGFGPTLRIVLWDTLLKKMGDREIVAVVGHEMGHYVEGHIIIGFIMGTAMLFAVVPLLAALCRELLRKYGPRWKLRSHLHDPAAIAVILLSVDLISLPLTPIINGIFRVIEHRADAFSLGVVRDRIGLAEAFVSFTNDDLDDPYPPLWEKLWFDSHPPIGERIHYALYGQPNQW